MVKLQILYANGTTAAMKIASDLFYIKTGPDLPELYDSNLKKLITPNLDYWLQAQTHQRYSLRGVCDMVEAFNDGLNHSYGRSDLIAVCERVFDHTVSYIFKTSHARRFAQSYWIELMNEEQARKLVHKIKEDFDKFLKQYGSDKFYTYLCRLWQFYNLHVPSEAAILERMISRLGRTPEEPSYPIIDVELEIKEHIITKDLARLIEEHKGIDREITNNVDRIQTGRLQGAN